MNRTGVAPLISYVLFVGVGIGVMAAAITLTIPVIENIRDTAAVEQSVNALASLDERMDAVSRADEGTFQRFALENDRGSFTVNEADNEIVFDILSESDIIGTHASRDIGPVTLSANADIDVEKRIMNGTECFWMENEYVEACVRSIDEDGDPQKNLVGYWRMNEGAGQEIIDNSLQNNTGTLGGSVAAEDDDPTWETGREGYALNFDGSEDYVVITDDTSLRPDEITLSAWIKPEELPFESWHRILTKRENTGGEGGYQFVGRSGTSQVRFEVTDASPQNYNIDTPSLEEETWYHLVLVSDNETLKGFLDGEEFGSITANFSHTTEGLYLGSRGDRVSFFNGSIDEVRIYNDSLVQREVRYLTGQRGRLDYINTSQLLTHYRNHRIDENPNMDLGIDVDGIDNTSFGTGFTEAERLGDDLGQGRVTAEVNSAHGFTYQINFDLLSGADFLKVSVD